MRDDIPAPVQEIEDFPGLQLAVDENHLPPGATHTQVNFSSEDVGAIKSSLRYRVVEFDA